MRNEIDWNNLETERSVRKTTFERKKLPEGVFACPSCHGSGQVVLVYCDPGPNKYTMCMTCHGTGEITKCKKEGCDKPVPNEKNWFPYGLCLEHEREFIKTKSKGSSKE